MPEKNPGVAARRGVRLRDIAGRADGVAAWCEVCGHHRVLEIAGLLRRLGPDATVATAARRLCCSRCGSRRVQARPHYPGLGVVAGHQPP